MTTNTGGTSVTRSRQPEDDPRLRMIEGLIAHIPDGYFATQAADGEDMTFIRISHPRDDVRRYGGSLKIQTQHGNALEVEAVQWPGGRWSIYRRSILDALMLLVVDYKGCALRYAHEIEKCCRCNSPLTDERSRHYGIGPECEGKWPWVITLVDEQDEG